jgi:hypothetical protein
MRTCPKVGINFDLVQGKVNAGAVDAEDAYEWIGVLERLAGEQVVHDGNMLKSMGTH